MLTIILTIIKIRNFLLLLSHNAQDLFNYCIYVHVYQFTLFSNKQSWLNSKTDFCQIAQMKDSQMKNPGCEFNT